ncbi:flagellar biosynthetic protein FlhB [Thermanaeromonas toyohensis ToBE]|uniref:Flagellar biosynthetic protein FlhB n=1 Tax=Thermanaeromonas toyohensis ToBE TaxID=698762 RepID=A0A1W1VLA7_9FIRM|nr:flagellar biosynthesis protein FlhB [Thermanaeromonas toyohensis]SMB94063.1 flagellar biosynthetic protein FlhB [Thermanaeromonas toyohensis ToBE]
MRFIDLQLFAEEKTEEATPHRLQEVRRKGQAARSNDLSASLVLLALVLFIYWRRESFWVVTWRILSTFLSFPRQELDADGLIALFYLALFETGKLLLLLFGVAAVVGLAANWAQVGFIFSTENLMPRLENLNPIKGFQRLFSRRSLVELGKSLAKVLIIGVVVWQVVRAKFQKLFLAPEMGLVQVAQEMARIIFEVALGAMAVYLVLGALDFVFQRREFLRALRMTREEVKEELKQTEGDPLVRSRLREKQRKLARHRMMHAVPQATVVITNPVHLAVALRYREEEGAPRVVAKGAGSIALRIIQVAREHRVPVIQNPPVAQALYRKAEIGEEIPVELYQAVAEILAYIYRIQGHW